MTRSGIFSLRAWTLASKGRRICASPVPGPCPCIGNWVVGDQQQKSHPGASHQQEQRPRRVTGADRRMMEPLLDSAHHVDAQFIDQNAAKIRGGNDEGCAASFNNQNKPF